MKIKICPKDTGDKVEFDDVIYTYQEGELFCAIFENGNVLKFPFKHIWYIAFPGYYTKKSNPNIKDADK